MDQALIIIALGAVVAGFIQGLSGFAFSMVAMSFWIWVIEPQLAAVLSVFGALTGQIIGALSVRRGFNLKQLLPFLLGGLTGIPLGVGVLPHLDVMVFKAALGLLLLIWCPVMLFGRHLNRIRFGGKAMDAVIGMIGGVMSGIGGLAGAVPTLWCSLKQLDKHTQRNIIQNFNLTVLAVTMATYLATGVVEWDMLPKFAVVGVAMLIPTLFGAKLYVGISEARFRQLVLGLLTASGAMLVAGSMPHLVGRL